MNRRRTSLIALAALAAGAANTSTPASAVDDSKPAVACYGQFFTDKKGDQASAAPGAQPGGRENLDYTGGFFKFDAAKGDEAATLNLQIANLTKDIPPGATAVSWYAATGQEEGDQWVRALTDFTGVVSYEYGHFTIVGPQTQSLRDGATAGGFFEGADGVIQIVLPKDGLGKPGTAMKALNLIAYEARQVLPGASPTPAKGGLLYEVDTAASKGTHTVGSPCPSAPPAAPAPAGPSAPLTAPPASSGGALPVKVATRSAKAKAVRKGLKVKLTSSEPLTALGAQLVKGKKVVATGKLAKLDGAGTLKLKFKGKPKKGTYRLDLAGTDKAGARRFVAAAIKLR
jgi:uncharacterized membrane protein